MSLDFDPVGYVDEFTLQEPGLSIDGPEALEYRASSLMPSSDPEPGDESAS